MGPVFVFAGTRNLSPSVLTEGSSEIPIVPAMKFIKWCSFFLFLRTLDMADS